MDDLKEKIYLLALDMIKDKKTKFICVALKKSYKEYIGTEELVSGEELEKLFPEFFNLYDSRYWYHRYWYQSEDKSILFMNQRDIHGCWWHYELMEPRKRILELILSSRCR